jgi:hypothetical protein
MLYHDLMATEAKRQFTHRWPDEPDTKMVCIVTIDYDVVNGRMEGTRLMVHMTHRNPMTTSVIRKLPLGAWMADDRTHLGGSSWEKALPPSMRGPLRKKRLAAERAKSGRPKVTYELLVEVAAVYRQAHAHGAAPTKAVADHFKRSRSTAAKWVQRARDERLLRPTAERRAGEQPRTRRKAKQ